MVTGCKGEETRTIAIRHDIPAVLVHELIVTRVMGHEVFLRIHSGGNGCRRPGDTGYGGDDLLISGVLVGGRGDRRLSSLPLPRRRRNVGGFTMVVKARRESGRDERAVGEAETVYTGWLFGVLEMKARGSMEIHGEEKTNVRLERVGKRRWFVAGAAGRNGGDDDFGGKIDQGGWSSHTQGEGPRSGTEGRYEW